MNIIEQAAKRLEELQRAGVEVPWAAAGFAEQAAPVRPVAPVGAPAQVPSQVPGPAPAQAPGQSPGQSPAQSPAHMASPAALAPSSPAIAFGVAPAVTPAMPLAPIAPEPSSRRSIDVEVDLNRLVRHGNIVPGMARSAISDEFRVIKRPLLKNAHLEGASAIRRGNLIAVTSAVPGEGKTFTAVNLAISMSMELDHSILLVDADVVRPSALSVLGLKAERGLMDVLRDPTLDLSEVLLKPSNIPKLTLLPAGLGTLNSTELLASAAMERLLDELATKYADRIVIFDAPPLMVTTESRVLASRVGQVVLVVEASHTPREVVAEAATMLSNCPVVLTVLNKYTGPSKVGMYGY